MGIMEYDHLIVPGMNYRRTKEDIMTEVKHDGKEWHDKELGLRLKKGEWHDKELGLRLKKGDDKAQVVSKLDADTKSWIDLEFQRRMNWNYEEEGTTPLD
jgi:hypothetical protein